MDKADGERVVVNAGEGTLGVVVTMGETVVTVQAPSPAGLAGFTEGHARGTALRIAARALEVAAQEIAQEQA